MNKILKTAAVLSVIAVLFCPFHEIPRDQPQIDTEHESDYTESVLNTPPDETEGQGETELIPENTYFELAKKNYLDFDSSSDKREVIPEVIIVHFTSGVVIDRDDPYNYDNIRDIFEGSEIGINYVIKRDGGIECWLPEERMAWHARVGK